MKYPLRFWLWLIALVIVITIVEHYGIFWPAFVPVMILFGIIDGNILRGESKITEAPPVSSPEPALASPAFLALDHPQARQADQLVVLWPPQSPPASA